MPSPSPEEIFRCYIDSYYGTSLYPDLNIKVSGYILSHPTFKLPRFDTPEEAWKWTSDRLKESIIFKIGGRVRWRKASLDDPKYNMWIVELGEGVAYCRYAVTTRDDFLSGPKIKQSSIPITETGEGYFPLLELEPIGTICEEDRNGII
jgi:hypothetical protein